MQGMGNTNPTKETKKSMIETTIRLTGVTPLLMHADTLADPISQETKAFKKVSSKRTKTDEDYERMALLEFRAALYWDNGPVVPNRNLMRCLIDGGKLTKSGTKVERGLVVVGQHFELKFGGFKGEMEKDALYADKNFVSRMTVKVGQARTVRCRPIFKNWSVTVPLLLDGTQLAEDTLLDIAKDAGAMVGLGDYRRGGGFGRFKVEKITK